MTCFTPHARSTRARRRHHRGLSLVEIMISIGIVAMLLTAAAAAWSASSSAVTVNDEFFRATQAARVSMTQMLDAVRKSTSSQVGDAAAQANNVVTATDLHIITTDTPSRLYTYQWFPGETGKPLKLIDSSGTAHVLARNIDAVQFTGVNEVNPLSGQRRTIRVTVTLLVKVGDAEIRLSGSAVPRCEMVYQ